MLVYRRVSYVFGIILCLYPGWKMARMYFSVFFWGQEKPIAYSYIFFDHGNMKHAERGILTHINAPAGA